jgi:hypothetical protein
MGRFLGRIPVVSLALNHRLIAAMPPASDPMHPASDPSLYVV